MPVNATVHIAITLFPFLLSIYLRPVCEGLTFLFGPKLSCYPFMTELKVIRPKEFYIQLECFTSEKEILFHGQAINDYLCYLNYC